MTYLLPRCLAPRRLKDIVSAVVVVTQVKTRKNRGSRDIVDSICGIIVLKAQYYGSGIRQDWETETRER